MTNSSTSQKLRNSISAKKIVKFDKSSKKYFPYVLSENKENYWWTMLHGTCIERWIFFSRNLFKVFKYNTKVLNNKKCFYFIILYVTLSSWIPRIGLGITFYMTDFYIWKSENGSVNHADSENIKIFVPIHWEFYFKSFA